MVVMGVAAAFGGAVMGGSDNDCCDNSVFPGCNDAACEALICSQDPLCCSESWDALCRDAAIAQCAVCGSCCQVHGEPGCSAQGCEEVVCSFDPFCCDNAWDAICVSHAEDICLVCGGTGCGDSAAGGCYVPNGSPGCDDAGCCQMVCAADPSCCDDHWDETCAGSAAALCGGCGQVSAGNCCKSNGSPACDDEECCQLICGVDPFCCDNTWDGICGNTAKDACSLCDTGACCSGLSCSVIPPLLCAISGGTYQGAGVACEIFTCGTPTFFGACCFGNGTCSTTSTTACAAAGGTFQGILTTCSDVDCGPCAGDTDNDGDVDSVDLNEVLADFGCTGPGCTGDVNNSGATDSTDLNMVLGGFGCGL